ncbi:General secretion pathway protein L [Pseudoalteromonas luteoviolacea B = ATCC 29581]|nr:General secretion pathway protein L [Pseudoalteromonas luteoviolacea B = ATCC 29581]
MKEMLLIRIGTKSSNAVHWLIWSSVDEQIIASGELPSCDLSILEEKAQSRETVVLLPSDQVTLKTVPLPTKWGRKLEQALPYLIEEQIAQDIDSIFIATEQATMVDDKHAIRIAYCDKAWLQNWLSYFSKANIEVHRLIPDALLLPSDDEATAHMVQLGDQWLLKYSNWQIAAIESSWLATFIKAANITHIKHYCPVNVEFAGVQLEAKQEQFDLPLALFAKQLPLQKLTLNQGTFAVKKKQPQWWSDWRSGLFAASAALVAFVVVKSVQLVALNKEVEQLKAQAVQTYQDAFPGKVVRPHLLRSQLRNALAGLDGSPSTNFLKLTEQLVTVLTQVNAFSIETMRFDQRRNELRIRARGKDFQSFGQVKALLEQLGLEVDQGSLNNDGDFIIGELRVKGA